MCPGLHRFTVLLSFIVNFAAAQTTDSRRPHLSADTFNMQLSLIQYFPFIDARVNGIDGKLMFDTGNEEALSLNDHLLPLKNGKTIGSGFVGSGQKFDVHLYDTVDNISIGNKYIQNHAGPVRGNNMEFLEDITPHAIGMLGYRFFEGYTFKMDYRLGLITFYKDTPARRQNKDFLKGEKVLAVLDFEIRKLPNHPIITIGLGQDSLAVAFDTGQLGALYLNDQLKEKWLKTGNLIQAKNGPFAALKDFKISKGMKVSLDQVYLFPSQNATGVKQAIGITEGSMLSLGYSFLKQYKTVWDFGARKIYLLSL